VNAATSDSRLIADVLRGQTAAYGLLMQRHQQRLYQSIFRLVNGQAEDAQDIVQEAFLNAYQALHTFKGDAEFFTWLYRIAYNLTISFRRKQRTTLSLQAPELDGSTNEPADESDGCVPGSDLERAELEARVQRAINQLPEEYRVVLILKDFENQKYETIAEIVQVPVGTIRSRLHRARLELRQLLAQEVNVS
jgi:RNA polymerase sigma-70 factor (ECF subfamily)